MRNSYTFEDLLRLLETATFEKIVCEDTNIECCADLAYFDGDLETFFNYLGAELVGYDSREIGNGYANIITSNNTYSIFYEIIPNRFDIECPNEIILHFNEITIDN